LNKYEKRYLAKYYLSIRELPLSNWDEFCETSNPVFLSKTGKICKRVHKVFEKLQDELIDTFGISHDYRKILEIKIKIELLYTKVVIDGDRTRLIFIEKLEQQLEDLEATKPKQSLMQSILQVNQHFNFKIDPKTTTVFEFYNYVKFVSEKGK